MTRHEDTVCLRHLVDAAKKGPRIHSRAFRRFSDSDEMLALAVVRLLEIMGRRHVSFARPQGSAP